jgi:hypothetical protein
MSIAAVDTGKTVWLYMCSIGYNKDPQMKKVNRYTLFSIVFSLLVFQACEKKDETGKNELKANGVIKQIKYACGPACDALTYSVKIADYYFVFSSELSPTFKQQDLAVTIRYTKTGRYPEQWKGPENMEIIDIITLEKR